MHAHAQWNINVNTEDKPGDAPHWVHLTCMLRNLEPIAPPAARGVEAWFRLVREYQGNTGPRLLRLVKAIFSPARVNLEQMAGAVEAWGHHVQDLELAGQRPGPVLKTSGLATTSI